MDVYDPIQQATCFVRSLGVTRSVSVSARATKAITFIYTFADLSWEMSYLLNFNVRIHLYSIPINFQKDCIDICFFSRHILWFSSLLWNCWAEQVLFTAPVASTTHFSFCSVHRRWTQPMTTLRALTEQDKRSVVPVRSDFWPKESNGLHKWAVVTKANISMCTVHCTVQCTVRCLHSSSWSSLRKAYDSVTLWEGPERQRGCVRIVWVWEEGFWGRWYVRRGRIEQLEISWVWGGEEGFWCVRRRRTEQGTRLTGGQKRHLARPRFTQKLGQNVNVDK